ncbi:hypothetical protein B0H67DRAFT_568063 [Lasiosphaeris hirsuta]|uniref:Gamma-butyrobetaine dioxygenase n=1 Tax=Lasiosphaeris hirsuta TaxID=260670 RepID=A0AA40E6Q2_9PEZI|nr:hypothetical protein B0H67DRAFT_568063 [Lasiosphaeris hirsuta]
MPPLPRISLATAGLLRAQLAPTTLSALRRCLFSHSVRTATCSRRPINTSPSQFRPLSYAPTRRQSSESTLQTSSDGANIKEITFHTHEPTDGTAMTLKFNDGPDLILSLLWLRDSCTCAHCVDPNSGQKNFSTVALPDNPEAESADVLPDGSLQVVWKPDSAGPTGTHTAVFPAADVEAWRRDKNIRPIHHEPVARTPWDKATYEGLLESGYCRVAYEDWLHSEDAYYRAFEALAETGLIFITGVPEGETEVEAIGQRIGTLQHTFYGLTWDVQSKPHAENVAYTNQFLGLHQDLLYHIPRPRLQLLHCIANSCEGGESLFSDGLRAAIDMRATSPDSYRTLMNAWVYFHYKKGGHSYEMHHPTINTTKEGHIRSIYWSPPFQAPFSRELMDESRPSRVGLAEWKTAATAFQASLEALGSMFEVKLKPGECAVFDNTRLVHGRREFATGSGHRWLKGTYISGQVFMAAQDRLQRRRGKLDSGNRHLLKSIGESEDLKGKMLLSQRDGRSKNGGVTNNPEQ